MLYGFSISAEAAPKVVVSPQANAVFGFVQDENGVKWMNADGTWAEDCWIEYLGLTYYLNGDGYIQVGLTYIDGKTYYLNANGTLTVGWLNIGEDLYFFYDNGTMAVDTEIGPYKFGKDGKLISFLNPNSEMQTLIRGIVASVTNAEMTQMQKLEACYNYILKNCSYKRTYETPSGDWTADYAKDILTTGKGNCYRYAAALAYLAKGVGFETRVATGQISAARGGVTPHAWTEVKIGEEWYIFDSEMQDAKNRDYYYKTYKSYPTKPLIKQAEWAVTF